MYKGKDRDVGWLWVQVCAYVCEIFAQWEPCTWRHGIKKSVEAIWFATQHYPQNDCLDGNFG